jgi:4-amino-4-deoxy-L-arabinose transferase-like glycosyltransferase
MKGASAGAPSEFSGNMPHRDFDDPYTGGLAYIDAFIFKLFGVNLFWLRLFLFVCFLVWLPAVYALAREFLSPLPAGAVTLIGVAWSVPNYTAAMPSWFNLFFAAFGTLALAKYIRKPAIHWLILAGLCGGLSFLVKSVALYYVAGALLFFVYREQSLSRIENARPRRTPLYLAFLTLCLSVFVFVAHFRTCAVSPSAFSEYLHFVFRAAVIALLLVCRERTSPTVSDLSRFGRYSEWLFLSSLRPLPQWHSFAFSIGVTTH